MVNNKISNYNIIICHTPFHLIQIKRMLKSGSIDKNFKFIFFYSRIIEKVEIQEVFVNIDIQFFEIPFYDSTVDKIRNDFFDEFIKFKSRVTAFKDLINSVFLNYPFHSFAIYTGTDKHIFDQCLFYILSRKGYKLNINVFDEGLGCYVRTNDKGKLYNKLFSGLSQILFGIPFIRISKLGSHPLTNTIHARYLELVHKEDKKSYVPIIVNEKLNISYGRFVTILTTPFYEEGVLTFEGYKNLLRFMVDSIKKNEFFKNWEIYIKPHPRESLDVFKELLIDKILPLTAIEKMEKIPVGLLIGFDSSSFIELIGSGVAKERIINISLSKNPILAEIIKNDFIYFKKLDNNFKLNLKAQIDQFVEKAIVSTNERELF